MTDRTRGLIVLTLLVIGSFVLHAGFLVPWDHVGLIVAGFMGALLTLGLAARAWRRFHRWRMGRRVSRGMRVRFTPPGNRPNPARGIPRRSVLITIGVSATLGILTGLLVAQLVHNLLF